VQPNVTQLPIDGGGVGDGVGDGGVGGVPPEQAPVIALP